MEGHATHARVGRSCAEPHTLAGAPCVLLTPRDLARLADWANETRPETKNTPNCGSAVAFFNTTKRTTRLLKAWAEAMAYEGNARAPDDQVRDLACLAQRGHDTQSQPLLYSTWLQPQLHTFTGAGRSARAGRLAQARLVWLAADVVPADYAFLLPGYRACHRPRPRLRTRAYQASQRVESNRPRLARLARLARLGGARAR